MAFHLYSAIRVLPRHAPQLLLHWLGNILFVVLIAAADPAAPPISIATGVWVAIAVFLVGLAREATLIFRALMQGGHQRIDWPAKVVVLAATVVFAPMNNLTHVLAVEWGVAAALKDLTGIGA